MTFDELRAAFKAAHPKSIDFPIADKGSAATVANEYGYRLAGVRLERAVFTTKQIPDALEMEPVPITQPTRG